MLRTDIGKRRWQWCKSPGITDNCDQSSTEKCQIIFNEKADSLKNSASEFRSESRATRWCGACHGHSMVALSSWLHSTQLLFLPVEARRLDGGLARVSEFLLPAGVDLVSVLLEGQECTLDLLVRLRVLDDSVREADIAVGACLPQLPRLPM